MIETVWRLSRFDGRWPWADYFLQIGIIFAILFAVLAAWWVFEHDYPAAQVRFTNYFGWTNLLPLLENSWPVTRAVPTVIVALYLSVVILDLQDRQDAIGNAVRTFNTRILHFNILGVVLDALDIFKLELLGCLLGWIIYVLSKLIAPTAFLAHDADDWRDPLAQTIRIDGRLVKAGNIEKTLRKMIGDFKELPDFKGHDWTTASARLLKLSASVHQNSPSIHEDAAELIEAFPANKFFLRQRTRALFDKTMPGLRTVFVFLLVASSFLAVIPILLRVLLLFFPILEGGT